MNKKIAIVLAVIVLGVLLTFGWSKLSTNSAPASKPQSPQVSEKDKPQIVSTKPDPLEGSIISASDVIEITFNRSLENVGEFKVRIDPKAEIKLELSGDRKTGKIIPVKPYELGSGYTIFIKPDTKFDGAGEWREEKIFHFRTIRYRGV